MQILARCRQWLVGSRLVLWLVVGALGAFAGVVVAGRVADLGRARQMWQSTRQVWVVARAADAGEPIVTEQRSYPLAVVPPAALSSLPANPIARGSVDAGQIVTRSMVSALGDAGLLPAGWVGVTVPTVLGTWQSGDEVRVLIAGQDAGPGLVVRHGEGYALVAVPASLAAPVADAASRSQVSLGLTASRTR